MSLRPNQALITSFLVGFSRALFLAGGLTASLGAAEDPASVLIMVNDATPPEPGTGTWGASEYVGRYYAQARGIPLSNILHINSPMGCCSSSAHDWDGWHISWNDFNSRIRTPLKDFLEVQGLKTRIKYVVPTYGVPSHIISYNGYEDLSVDSFIASTYSPESDEIHASNPLFREDPKATPPHWNLADLPWPMYAVTRLDGPSPALAVSLVDRALLAERGIVKTSGQGYFDYRGLRGTDLDAIADQSVSRAATLCADAGLDCKLNDQSVTGEMIASAPNTLWAWGWSEALLRDVYSFAPGAVGAQLLSGSAYSIRSIEPGTWVPLWITRGITATWGATSKSDISRYATGDGLLNRLWNGYGFGEAAYSTAPSLNYTMVFLGDPLYTPLFVDQGKAEGYQQASVHGRSNPADVGPTTQVTTTTGSVVLSLGTGVGIAGGTVDLNLNLTSSSGGSPAGVQWSLSYPADITGVTVSAGASATGAGKSLTCNTNTCLIYGLNSNLMGDGTAAVATFRIASAFSGGTIPIQVTGLAASPDGNSIPVSGGAGSITVQSSGPVISTVQASNMGASSATITWTTSTAADSQVEYGPDSTYGSSTTLDPAKVTSHTVNLQGLAQSTLYHYRVKSRDANNILVTSGDFTFTTIAAVGFSVTGSPASVNLGGTFTVSWIAPSGRPTSDWIALYPVGAANNAQIWWQYTGGATSGSAGVPAPTMPGQYEFRYLLQNGYTDTARSGMVTVANAGITLTATPASVNPGNTVTVNWTAPSGRPATDWIGLFQAGAPNTGAIWWQNTNGAPTGSATATAPSTLGTYEFRYFLQGGYTDAGHSNSVTVAAVSGPVITNVQATNITLSSANITWTTSTAADTQVEYGKTSAYGSSTTLNTTKVTLHTVAVTGLSASTLYHFRVKSTDAAGNTATSGDFTFTTLAAIYSLTAAPVTISLGASVTANWTAPVGSSATDWVGFYAAGAPNSPAISWQYTGGATTGSFTATPASIGTYEFRYLLTGGYTDVARSTAITVNGSGFTLTATPASVNPGNNVTVTWTTPSPRSSNDWIGLYQVGAPNSPSLWFAYTNGAMTGTASAPAPTALGQYEFRYLLAGGYTDVVHSNSFAVVASTGPVISNVQATGITSSTATITWTTSTAADSQVEYGGTAAYGLSTVLNTTRVTSHSAAIIGLLASTPYHYRVKSTDAQGGQAVSADFTFTTSAPTYSLSAAPATIALGASVTANWTAPPGSPANDWVGFFAVGAPNSPAIAWRYTGGTATGSFVATPAVPGTYEFRYLLSNGYTDVARSNIVTVTAVGFSLTATPATVNVGGTVMVNWTAPSGRPGNDWVGFFRVGAPNTPSIAWRYANGATSGSFTVAAPAQSGSYEFRYLLTDGYTDVARSNTVTVP